MGKCSAIGGELNYYGHEQRPLFDGMRGDRTHRLFPVGLAARPELARGVNDMAQPNVSR